MKGKFRLEIRKKFFAVRLVRCCSRFPREVVGVSALEVFWTRQEQGLIKPEQGKHVPVGGVPVPDGRVRTK